MKALIYQLEALRLEIRAAASQATLDAAAGKISDQKMNEGIEKVNLLRDVADDYAGSAKGLA